ncbi:MAG: hypothetical protein ACUVTL_02625 [Thermoproteota archaeon]
MISELTRHRMAELPKIVEIMKENLNKEMNNWGIEAIDLKINSVLQSREEVKQVSHEPTPSIEVKIPQRPITFRNVVRRDQQSIVSRSISSEVEWENATKRWVPQSKRGEVKCDGCSSDLDWYADCDQNCRSSSKCKLCKECYLKRKICAFV